MNNPKTDPNVNDETTVKLRLKTLIRTDEAFLIDLGQGKVWIPKSAIKSSRRIDQGILEVEVVEDVLKAKRAEMRRLKEQLTGVKGSIKGEVVELNGELLDKNDNSLTMKFGKNELELPRVCVSEWEELTENEVRFVIQKDFLEYKLQQMQNPDPDKKPTLNLTVKVIQETDRACLIKYEGREFWYPKRGFYELKPVSDDIWEVVAPTDFWRFKVETGTA